MNHATYQHALAAMKAGRLDEAASLLTAEKVRPHRQAQEALTQVCKGLIDRGNEHLRAHRLREAKRDAARVLGIEPGHADAAELLKAVTELADIDRRDAKWLADELAHAQQLADLGDSTHARQAAQDLDNTCGQRLVQRLDIQKLQRQTLITRAEDALQRSDWDAAAHALDRLAVLKPASAYDTLKHTLQTQVRHAVQEHLQHGQIDAAIALTQHLPTTDPLTKACQELRAAGEQLAQGNPAAALLALQRAASHLPQGSWAWLGQTIEQARQLRDLHEALAIKLIAPLTSTSPKANPLAHHSHAPAQRLGCKPVLLASPLSAPDTNAPLSQAPLILQQNGKPLAVLCTTPRVELTADPNASAPHHLPLLLSQDNAGLTLARDEDGHLIRSVSQLTVNQNPTTAALLADQDRIALGPRVRLRYLKANPASQTAVLELTAGRFAMPHLRRVVLLANELLIGPHRGCHLREPSLEEAITLRATPEGLTLNGSPLSVGAPAVSLGSHTWSLTKLESEHA